MSDLLAAAAAATGVPEALVERAAAARAQAAGVSVDAILQAWAGGEAIAAPEPPPAPQASADSPQPSEETSHEPPATSDELEPVPAVAAAVATVPPVPTALPAPDVPESVGVGEATEWPVVTTVSSAGLKERTGSVVPRWLMSVFVIVPFFALGYLLVFTGGTDCGNAGQLDVDRFGQVVNCDGTPFEGKATASAGQVDYFALGAEVYGRTGSCAGCHGDNGEGGAGPAFSGGAVTAVFGVCEDHVTWVRLGTQGYGAEVGSTYGDQAKPVGGGGVMPGFAQLTEEELRGVVLYERVRFGGEDEAVSLTECGLVTPEPDEEAPAEGEAPTDESMDAEGIEASAGAGS